MKVGHLWKNDWLPLNRRNAYPRKSGTRLGQIDEWLGVFQKQPMPEVYVSDRLRNF